VVGARRARPETGLDIPVVLDLECGHVPPRMPLVNGALCRLVVENDRRELTQSFT
jgi:muramoyltetrapeptide carboxypeptidase LdcA involved in peptidoglycan recycling